MSARFQAREIPEPRGLFRYALLDTRIGVTVAVFVGPGPAQAVADLLNATPAHPESASGEPWSKDAGLRVSS